MDLKTTEEKSQMRYLLVRNFIEHHQRLFPSQPVRQAFTVMLCIKWAFMWIAGTVALSVLVFRGYDALPKAWADFFAQIVIASFVGLVMLCIVGFVSVFRHTEGWRAYSYFLIARYRFKKVFGRGVFSFKDYQELERFVREDIPRRPEGARHSAERMAEKFLCPPRPKGYIGSFNGGCGFGRN